MYGKSMWEAAFERSLDRLDEHTGNGTRAAFLVSMRSIIFRIIRPIIV